MYLYVAVILASLHMSVDGGRTLPLLPPSPCVVPDPQDVEPLSDLFDDSGTTSDEIEAALNAEPNNTRLEVLTDKALNEIYSVAIPVFFQTAPMCKYKQLSYNPGRVIWWNKQYCKILSYFWYQNWNYVYCPPQYCQNVPCNKFTKYVYRCRPSCYRYFSIWVYCPKSPTGVSHFQQIKKKLPQCCECFRYKC